MVVSQQTAEALTALDLTVALTNLFIRLDDLVAKALVISFLVIMFQVRKSSSSQRVLTEFSPKKIILDRHSDFSDPKYLSM